LTVKKAVQKKKKGIKWKKNAIGSKLFSKFRDLKENSGFLGSFVKFEQKPYINSFESCHQPPNKKVEEKMS
jgi:hypothetical protein